MSFIDLIIEQTREFLSHPSVLLIGAITVFEISPIKINPWKALFKWLGNAINGDIKNDLKDLKRDFEETKAQDKRWRILEFATSCRNGVRHSREEWKHAISEIADYEAYTKAKKIRNGVIEEDTKYLRELYHERNLKNDFL